jgi:hypothetical protein
MKGMHLLLADKGREWSASVDDAATTTRHLCWWLQTLSQNAQNNGTVVGSGGPGR